MLLLLLNASPCRCVKKHHTTTKYIMNPLKIVSLLIICLFTIQIGQAQQALLEKYSQIKPIEHKPNPVLDDWEDYFFAKEDCQCVQGDQYFISLKETDPNSENLMISLQGGGACWPGMERCKTDVAEHDVATGSFTTNLAEKLGGTWNHLTLPYCDGSIYLGDTAEDYDNNGETDHIHDGLKISIAALSFLHEKYPNAKKIFLTGCSAGGYGTIIQTRLLRQLYPDAALYVLNESGPGLFRPDTDFWELIDDTWNLNQLLPEDCEKCEGQLIYWYDELLRDPNVKIGLYCSYKDKVISQSFLKLDPEDFKALLVNSTQELVDKYPDRFKRFFIKGNSHCVQDREYTVKGIAYWEWVLAFMNETEQWTDVMEE